MKILVVEDDKKLGGFLRKGLEARGFVVDFSSNGDEGYTLATTRSYDALVLDIMLPGRDGLSILRNLRDRRSTVPVLLLTARSALNERLDGLNLGADDYLTKPFAVGELMARIRVAIRYVAQPNPESTFTTGDLSVDLARRIVANSCFQRVFFANSGAEANEGAIKLARKWGAKHKGGAYEIITFEDSFHGRTLATMSASGKPAFAALFEPKVPGFPKARLGDLASVEALVGDRTVAVMLEPVQGEAGVIPASPDFLRALRSLCDRPPQVQA